MRCWVLSAAFAAFFLTPSAASAQEYTWTVGNTAILSSANVAYAPNGVGGPSVERDPRYSNSLIMVFEYRSAATHPSCPGGIWGLGIARGTVSTAAGTTSISWAVIDGDPSQPGINPLIEPTPGAGTYRDCVAAHPSVLWSTNANNKFMRVYFKAEDDTVPTVTGLGAALVEFNGNGTVRTVTTNPLQIPISDTFGFASVIRRESGTYAALIQKKIPGRNAYELFTATSPTEIGGWTLSATPSLTPDVQAIPWALNELYTPDLFCDDTDPTDGVSELNAWVGGRTFAPGSVVTDAGFSRATSWDGGVSFTMDPTQEVAWANSDDFRHIEMVGYDAPTGLEFLLFFSDKNPGNGGRPQIEFGYTAPTLSFSATQIRDGHCP